MTIRFWVGLGTGLAIASTIGLGTGGAIASTEVPITAINFAGGDNARRAVAATLIVPDRDTTESAYGGSLRLYDVHLAKMFEVTLFTYCEPNSNWNAVEWNYYAANGSAYMGQFTITCKQARSIASAYGLGRPERTAISYRGGAARQEMIPVLDLNGGKISRWLTFAQNFRPAF